MDKSAIDFTGKRYGFIEAEAQIKDLDGEERNLQCLHHVLELLKMKISHIYKGTDPVKADKKLVFFQEGSDKKNEGSRVFYSFGGASLKAGFAIQHQKEAFKDIAQGLSFEEILNNILD